MLLSIFFSVKIIDGNKCPQQKPLILVINHVHRLDMVIVMSFLPIRIHPIMAYDVIRGHTFLSGIVRLIANLTDTIVIRRDEELNYSAIKQMVHSLKCGEILGIAPEGTRSRNEHLGKGKKGAAYLARKVKVPILPVVTYGYKRHGGNFRREVTIAVGDVFSLENKNQLRLLSSLDHDMNYIMSKVSDILAVHQQNSE